jgi:hypothetical protein
MQPCRKDTLGGSGHDDGLNEASQLCTWRRWAKEQWAEAKVG